MTLLADVLVEELAEEMEQAEVLERKVKLQQLFPSLKVTITNVGEEYSSTFTYANYKYRVTISNEGRRMQVTFHDSILNYQANREPELLEVVNSVVVDAGCYESARDVEDFCSEYGYGDKAQGTKVYKACEKEYNNLIKVFGEKGYKVLGAIVRGY